MRGQLQCSPAASPASPTHSAHLTLLCAWRNTLQRCKASPKPSPAAGAQHAAPAPARRAPHRHHERLHHRVEGYLMAASAWTQHV